MKEVNAVTLDSKVVGSTPSLGASLAKPPKHEEPDVHGCLVNIIITISTRTSLRLIAAQFVVVFRALRSHASSTGIP
jgi:hypothetical protein